MSPLQKARMVAAAPGLYCDVEAIVRGSLAHFGLLDAAEAAAADE